MEPASTTDNCNPSRIQCKRCGGRGHATKDCLQYLPQTSELASTSHLKRPREEHAELEASKRLKTEAPTPWRPSREIKAVAVPGSERPSKAMGNIQRKTDWSNWRQDAASLPVPNRGIARQHFQPAERNAAEATTALPSAPTVKLPSHKSYNPFATDSDSDDQQPMQPQPACLSPTSSPLPNGSPRSPTPEPDEFGRTVTAPRSPSPDLLSLPWEERMDRMIDRIDRQKSARDLLRAKYGQISPSPPRASFRSATPPSPPANAPLPKRPKPAAASARPVQLDRGRTKPTIRNWESALQDDFFEDSVGMRPSETKGGRPQASTALEDETGPVEEDEAEAAFEARLRELQREEEEEEEEEDPGFRDALR
eukprot:GGOE01053702.1.p1 GENE.GGOE01053702.1~~GGOE01053702.1.p1  ORF type:complete len:367 (+),score=37.64 GGOE01053702.1:119-1219(+)